MEISRPGNTALSRPDGHWGGGRSLMSWICREGLPGTQSASIGRETNHSHSNIGERNSDTFPTQKESSASLGLTWGQLNSIQHNFV